MGSIEGWVGLLVVGLLEFSGFGVFGISRRAAENRRGAGFVRISRKAAKNRKVAKCLSLGCGRFHAEESEFAEIAEAYPASR